VGFSVREPGPAAPDIDVGHYLALLANTADFMVERLDSEIIFVPMEHRKKDVQHSHAVVAQMQCAQRARVLKAEYSAAELLSLFSHFQFAVGMRLHFLIFAALQGVPFVALPYASKVEGFIEDLDMPMPPLKQVTTGRLIAHIDRCLDQPKSLRERMERNLPGVRQRAKRTHEIVLQVLSERTERRRPRGAA
jgi:polysaccharide pyruvyl transferase WcaK-like protein